MISLIKSIFKSIGKGFYYLLLPCKGVHNVLCLLTMEIRMGYLSSLFQNMGNNVYIRVPNRIIGHKYISIGNSFSSLYGLRIEAFDKYLHQTFSPKIVIGNNVCFNTDCHIACINRIVIGNNVLIASRVFITDHAHGGTDSVNLSPLQRPLVSKGSVIIGNNVWIGEGAVILPNVKIGDNCIIGANSVVTKDMIKNSVIAGVPGNIIKTLN